MDKYIRGISWGSVITVGIVVMAIIFGNNPVLDKLFLYEVMPYFTVKADTTTFAQSIEPVATEVFEIGNAYLEVGKNAPVATSQNYSIASLKDINVLRQNLYAVDKKTGMTQDLFDIDKLTSTNIHINKSNTEPKILIFHTHARELYADSKDKGGGVVGAGAYLAKLMEERYGVKCLHITSSFDIVNGQTKTTGAYERMEPEIKKILAENPSIELVIDLHRDGVKEGVKLVSDIDGKPTAKIMFFNGLCKLRTDGKLNDLSNLSNPYLPTNLALSAQMQLKANELYPTLTRKIYLNAYRYSLHMKDKSMLIELGAQTNTEEEVSNAVEKLAEILNLVVFE